MVQLSRSSMYIIIERGYPRTGHTYTHMYTHLHFINQPCLPAHAGKAGKTTNKTQVLQDENAGITR